MRQYAKDDYQYIRNALLDEGLTDEQMTFRKDITILTDFGFFSYRIEHGYPFLSHFYVDKDKRCSRNALILYRLFKETIKSDGYISFIAEVMNKKEYLNRFVKWLSKRSKPYSTANDSEYYLVGV